MIRSSLDNFEPRQDEFILHQEFKRDAQISRSIKSYNHLAKTIVLKIAETEHELVNKKVILVVDDEPLMFQLVQEFLEEANIRCQVLTALDSQKGYELAVSTVPNLIITDWLMDEVDGLDLIRRLKSNPATASVPVIMATGVMVRPEEINKILELGVIDILEKPLDQKELRTRVILALALDDSAKETKLMKQSFFLKNQFVNFLIGAAPNPVFYQDGFGRFIGCNGNFERLVNCNKSSIIGKTTNQFIPGPFADALEVQFSSLRERGSTCKFEIDFHNSATGARHLEVSYIALGDSSGEVIVGSINDITKFARSDREVSQLQKIHAYEKEQFVNNVEQLRGELEFKHRELMMNLQLLIHSRNVKEKLLDSLDKLSPFLTADGKPRLSAMMRQLQWELNDETQLAMEKKFDELHAELYVRLEKSCAEITKNEKRLCAYLKMSHSAADIARITDKSLNSVNVGFARLRTKLRIPSNKDLRSFLNELI